MRVVADVAPESSSDGVLASFDELADFFSLGFRYLVVAFKQKHEASDAPVSPWQLQVLICVIPNLRRVSTRVKGEQIFGMSFLNEVDFFLF